MTLAEFIFNKVKSRTLNQYVFEGVKVLIWTDGLNIKWQILSGPLKNCGWHYSRRLLIVLSEIELKETVLRDIEQTIAAHITGTSH